MKILFLFASVSILISGCAMGPVDEAKKQEINNVGVALLFEDTIPVVYMGTTIFNNKDNRVDISSWKLNEIILGEMESGLKSSGKTFKKLNFDTNKVKESLASGDTGYKRMLGTTDEEVNEYIFSTAVSQGASYLFVFHPIKSENHPQPKGFGLFCRSRFGSKGDWHAYALFHVALWDLKTKSKIFQTAFDPNDIGFESGKPCEEIKTTTVDKFAVLFKEQLQVLAKKSAQMTLKKSGLVK